MANETQERQEDGWIKLLRKSKLGAFGLVALALFFVLPVILQYFINDPLPRPIRTKLNYMDATGKEIQYLASRAKAFNDTTALTDVQSEYERIEISFNQILQQAQDGIELNSVDTAFLQSALGDIEPREVELRNHLYNISRPISEAGVGEGVLKEVWKMLRDATQKWSELFRKKAEMNQILPGALRTGRGSRRVPTGFGK